MLYPWPACGFEVFDEPAGSYVICAVCGWEDDHVQLRFPAMRGGANKESLFEWQQQIIQQIPPHVTIHEGYYRCGDWRPLSQDDCADCGRMPEIGLEYFEAAADDSPGYYWRRARTGTDRTEE